MCWEECLVPPNVKNLKTDRRHQTVNCHEIAEKYTENCCWMSTAAPVYLDNPLSLRVVNSRNVVGNTQDGHKMGTERVLDPRQVFPIAINACTYYMSLCLAKAKAPFVQAVVVVVPVRQNVIDEIEQM